MTTFGTISQIALIFSSLGMIGFIARKVPALLKFSKTEGRIRKPGIFYSKLKQKAKNISLFRYFSAYEVLLQKILFQIRILTLKTDSKTFNWLRQLREKSKTKKINSDNYWQKLKKIKKEI
ncbi:MAG: hypothetical protein V1705_02960 [bacterium]